MRHHPQKSDLQKIWSRIERATLFLQPSIRTILVGGHPIRIHHSNPLYWSYREDQSLSLFMGHLASCVEQWWPEGSIIDVGANVGDTLALFRSVSHLPVLCVEGDDFAYSFLEKNSRQFPHVRLAKQFLSDRNETVELKLEKKGWNTTLVPVNSTETGQSLQLLTLDALLDQIPDIQSVKLLKVDAEGYDMKILRGAKDILRTDRPVVLFELNAENIRALDESPGDFFDYLSGLGYFSYLFFDPFGDLLCVLHEPEKERWLDFYRYSADGGRLSHFDVCCFHHTNHDQAVLFEESWRSKVRTAG